MATNLILKNADFSENGIFNPIINWFVNYMDDISPLPTTTRLGSRLDVGYGLCLFPELAGKKVRYISFRLDYNLPFDTSMCAAYLNFYNYDDSTKKCSKIGNSVPYTIDSVGENSIMMIDLGQNYEIKDGLGIFGFDESFDDRAFSIICGLNTAGGNGLTFLNDLSGTLDEITGVSKLTVSNWRPDIKFGCDA